MLTKGKHITVKSYFLFNMASEIASPNDPSRNVNTAVNFTLSSGFAVGGDGWRMPKSIHVLIIPTALWYKLRVMCAWTRSKFDPTYNNTCIPMYESVRTVLSPLNSVTSPQEPEWLPPKSWWFDSDTISDILALRHLSGERRAGITLYQITKSI